METEKHLSISNKGRVPATAILVPASFMLAALTIWQVRSGTELALDKAVTGFAASISNPATLKLAVFFTELGSKWGIGGLFLISLLALWWRKKDYLGMLILVLGVIGGDQFNKFCKEVIARERPMINPDVYAEGYSFPSGHAMVGLIFYGLLIYLFTVDLPDRGDKKKATLGAGLLVLLIGFSRIMLEAHYPTDILGGYAIGFLYLLGCIALYKLGRKRAGKA